MNQLYDFYNSVYSVAQIIFADNPETAGLFELK
jgi:hypothetical protein